MSDKSLIPNPTGKPIAAGKGALRWFYKETFGNWVYDQLGVLGRSAVMTTTFALVVRFVTTIPVDLLLIGALFVAALVFFSLQRLLNKRRNAQPVSAVIESPTIDVDRKIEKAKEALNAHHQSEIKALKKELGDAREDYAEEIEGRKSAFATLESKYATLLQQNKGLHAQLAKQSWMYNIAGKQAEQIDRHVILDRIQRADARLHDADGWPFIRFHFYILNKSVFDITVELDNGAKDSYIVFKDEGLRPERFLGIPNNQLHISHFTEGCLTIEQQLSAPQAHFLNRSTGQDDAIFYFDRLVINIRGSHNVEPQLEEKRLVIDKAISINNELTPVRR